MQQQPGCVTVKSIRKHGIGNGFVKRDFQNLEGKEKLDRNRNFEEESEPVPISI